jgi:short subunit dehydrogenase-like uncharacterized protein
MSAREFDIVLFGATGFTGKLVAEQLCGFGNMRWAVAGRNVDKLQAVVASLPASSAAPEIVCADATDRASLDALVARARVVITTVGPYAAMGSELVAACANAGTHYCDLTGEVHWVRAMIDAHHQRAKETGARIVHCCGFDSIPADVSCWLLQHELQSKGQPPAASLRGYYSNLRGGVSGGTVASMRGIIQAAMKDRHLRRLLVDRYALVPSRSGQSRQREISLGIDRAAGVATAPFVMAGINTRVVYRSNDLLANSYGADFTYHEAMAFPLGARGLADAAKMAAGVSALPVAMAVPQLAKLLDRKLPKSGEGPSEKARQRGRYTLRVSAADANGITVTFKDNADPGYGSTSKMLSAAATCLAFDALESPGGVLTPMAAMGNDLIVRLRNAGIEITVSQ